ncbi:MAG: hypothetical protein ACE5G0_14505 [Rhodothermales bacterium]
MHRHEAVAVEVGGVQLVLRRGRRLAEGDFDAACDVGVIDGAVAVDVARNGLLRKERVRQEKRQ